MVQELVGCLAFPRVKTIESFSHFVHKTNLLKKMLSLAVKQIEQFSDLTIDLDQQFSIERFTLTTFAIFFFSTKLNTGNTLTF